MLAQKPLVWIGLFLLLLTGGCGSGTDKLEVSGTVTFKNKPLDQGVIQFEPLDPTLGTGSGDIIKDGKYRIPREKGLKAGKYLVRISSGEPGSQAAPPVPGESGPPAKERIPPEYNRQSKQKVEVGVGKPNVIDFNIQ